MDYKALLLSSLDDKDVREKLLSVLSASGVVIDNQTRITISENAPVNQNEASTYQKDIDELGSENQSMKRLVTQIRLLLGLNDGSEQNITDEISRLQKQLKIKNDELSEKNNTILALQQENQEKAESLKFYQSSFSQDLEIAKLYSELSEQTKLSLAGIFKSNSVTGLVACGVQEKNISNLWDYAKSEMVNGLNDDLDKIVVLFDLLFSRFVLAYPMFAQQAVNVGDVFDTHLHIKHNASINTSGLISKVLLRGYLNTKTDKVVKASLVVL